jgi:AmmeMemoRadiSam system protein A
MTDFASIKNRIEIRQIDITTLAIDAIVNAANERMLGGGGVDGAIHRAAGGALLEECMSLPEIRPGVRCPTGEARLTFGHNLPARYVIHTVGPIWHGGDRGEEELLASCYRSSLEVASDNGIRTIAFPAISCGVYGYPLEKAAAVAVHEVAEYLIGSPDITRVVFAAFDSSVENALENAIESEPLLRSAPAGDETRTALTDTDKRTLLSLARQTLLAHLEGRERADVGTESEAAQQHRAAFVTLRTRTTGELRGCIGEVIARRPLIESVARMAVSAGTQDPRFPPASAEELDGLTIEISALTPMMPIRPDEVVVGKHGLMISKGHCSGLLLPQVPIEQGWDRERYLRGLCAKAGLPSDAWRDDDVELRSFEAEVWGEEE